MNCCNRLQSITDCSLLTTVSFVTHAASHRRLGKPFDALEGLLQLGIRQRVIRKLAFQISLVAGQIHETVARPVQEDDLLLALLLCQAGLPYRRADGVRGLRRGDETLCVALSRDTGSDGDRRIPRPARGRSGTTPGSPSPRSGSRAWRASSGG